MTRRQMYFHDLQYRSKSKLPVAYCFLWKAITFLCGHSLLHDLVSPLCDVVSSLCDVVSPLRGVVSSLYDGVSPLRDVVLSLCVVVSPLCDVVLSLCDKAELEGREQNTTKN